MESYEDKYVEQSGRDTLNGTTLISEVGIENPSLPS